MAVGIDTDICDKIKCENYTHGNADVGGRWGRCTLKECERTTWYREYGIIINIHPIPENCLYRNIMITTSKKDLK